MICRLARKADNTLPAVASELRGNLSDKSLLTANPLRVDSQNGQECGHKNKCRQRKTGRARVSFSAVEQRHSRQQPDSQKWGRFSQISRTEAVLILPMGFSPV